MVAITLQTSFVGARSAVLAKGRQTSCMAPASSGRAVPARARRASLSVSAKSVPGVGLMMTRKPVCCKPGDSVDDAAGVLLGGSFSHLPVVDADGKLVGVLSESDLLFTGDLTSQYEEDNIKSDAKTVEDAMTKNVISITEKTKFDEAAHTMLSKKIHCLPVVDDAGMCVGIVSRKDILRYGFRPLLQQ